MSVSVSVSVCERERECECVCVFVCRYMDVYLYILCMYALTCVNLSLL